MAIKLTLREHNGIEATYWNVGSFRLNKKLNFLDCKMFGYIDYNAYLNGENPIMTRPIRCVLDKYKNYFSIERMNEENNNIIKLIYEFIANENTIFSSGEPLI